ncbi:MAG: ATP-binding cassette domain-containing protein, partial [Candidatus Bathyarchaeia archaeon]
MKDVSKSYGRIAALRDVSLTIGKGVTGLIGPNGAGKSTLIKIILGLIKLSQGSVRVFGVDPWVNGRNVRRRVGILHEKPRFPGWATGYDFVKFVGGLSGFEDPGLK